MQYYLETLPDYQTARSNQSGTDRTDNDYDSDSSPGTTEATTVNNASGQDGKHRNDNNNEMNEMQAHLKMQQNAPAKKAKDANKAAANLQKASDLQRQKFMDVFQQMQASPVTANQKTYKVKSESKPVVNAGVQPSSLRPENPFSKVKAVVVNPIADSPKSSEKAMPEMTSDFRPFGEPLSNQISPDKQQPTIFDKLDNKVVKNEMAQKMEKIEAENVATLKAATAKVDKRLRGKKGGKLVKGVVTITSSNQDETMSNSTVSPEKSQRDTSLPKTVSESMPQLPSLFKAQSTQNNAAVNRNAEQIQEMNSAASYSTTSYARKPLMSNEGIK